MPRSFKVSPVQWMKLPAMTKSLSKLDVWTFHYRPSIITPWPFRPKGYCRCLRLSVCKLYLVRTITRHKFQVESWTTWFGNVIARSPRKNVFEFRVISTIYYGLLNDYRCKFSFIHHLLLLIVIFLFFNKKLSGQRGIVVACVCRSVNFTLSPR